MVDCIHQKHQADLFKNFLLEEICVKFAMLVNYILLDGLNELITIPKEKNQRQLCNRNC
jgi:hypothetical protein